MLWLFWRGPFSIVRRLTALAVVVSVFALLFNVLLVFLAVSPLFEDLSGSIAAQISSVRTALQALPPAMRIEEARSLSLVGSRVYRTASPPMVAPSDVQLTESGPFLERIRQRLAPGFDLSLRQPENSGARSRLLASFMVDQERWVIEFPALHGSPRGPLWSLLAALLFAALIPLCALVAGIRLITRPMARLAKEVADRSDRLRPLDMHHAAGNELREIFLSFNGLVKGVISANEARRNMLAGVSHDLRAPLARLRLRAEVECPPQTSQALEADCNALDRIIGQFLAYAQGEAGVSLGVAEPLSGLVRHIGSFFADRGVSVVIEDEVAARVAYPDMAIWRIVTNLVDNAVAHGQAPITLRVDVGEFECRLTVSDAGLGIATHEVEEAFKPFVKLRKSARGPDDELGHCGLGLAIVAQICAELGGKIFCLPFDGVSSGVGVALPLPVRDAAETGDDFAA